MFINAWIPDPTNTDVPAALADLLACIPPSNEEVNSTQFVVGTHATNSEPHHPRRALLPTDPADRLKTLRAAIDEMGTDEAMIVQTPWQFQEHEFRAGGIAFISLHGPDYGYTRGRFVAEVESAGNISIDIPAGSDHIRASPISLFLIAMPFLDVAIDRLDAQTVIVDESAEHPFAAKAVYHTHAIEFVRDLLRGTSIACDWLQYLASPKRKPAQFPHGYGHADLAVPEIRSADDMLTQAATWRKTAESNDPRAAATYAPAWLMDRARDLEHLRQLLLHDVTQLEVDCTRAIPDAGIRPYGNGWIANAYERPHDLNIVFERLLNNLSAK